MKAWVLHNISDIRLEDVEEPVLQEGEVLVQVKAVGICGSDIPRIYQNGTYRHPLIPGHEFSGVAVKSGPAADTALEGQRVGVFPLIPCKECPPCRKKQYEMCRNYSYLGSRRDGGFAEYVAVPEENLVRLPDHVSFEAAAMLEPMAVAVHAMRRVKAGGSDRIAICGVGTIGLLLYLFLKEAGMEQVYVFGNKDFQKQTLLKLGLREEFYCDIRENDTDQWLMERTEGVGADVFFECVGRNETLVQALNQTAFGGRIMLVGNPFGDVDLEKSVYWKILRNQLTVMGTWNSSFTHEMSDDWNYVMERLAQKRVVPEDLITHRLSLEQMEQGFRIMRDKTEDYVKIMMLR
ncbi:MAG: galactitol-1-phosphate 5-dehydrogenase [Dorea sp.]|jgi:L-iditol 2-dehydrogenase|nr:galactitol-1-phosphate 5-dehydrogenase [Dorea sp.]